MSIISIKITPQNLNKFNKDISKQVKKLDNGMNLLLSHIDTAIKQRILSNLENPSRALKDWSDTYKTSREFQRARGLNVAPDKFYQFTGGLRYSLRSLLNRKDKNITKAGNGHSTLRIEIGKNEKSAFGMKLGIAQSGRVATGHTVNKNTWIMFPVTDFSKLSPGMRVFYRGGVPFTFAANKGNMVKTPPTPSRPLITNNEVDQIVNKYVVRFGRNVFDYGGHDTSTFSGI
jgi:hypothetical protein